MQTLFPAGDGIFQNDNAPIHAAELNHGLMNISVTFLHVTP